jgi:ATP adenylyltransferase
VAPDDDGDGKDRPPSHVIVLNRFPIIANHFILATVPFKPQDEPLDADDLAATYACLRAWEEEQDGASDDEEEGQPRGKRRLIAFFNMGPLSGASQPHRHVQFLPEEDVRAGTPAAAAADDGGAAPWRPLIDLLDPAGPAAAAGAAGEERGPPAPPFLHFRAALPPDASAAALRAAYAGLLARTGAAWLALAAGRGGGGGGAAPPPFSCNWAMVRGALAMCPRLPGGAGAGGPRGEEAGRVAVNGAVLAGALMVTRRAEWDRLTGDEGALDQVLSNIGVPSESWKQYL